MLKSVKKTSWVWGYFELVPGQNPDSVEVKKCKRCSYVCPSQSASTSAMAFHLVSKHGFTATSKSEEGLHTIHGGAGGCSSGIGKITKQFSLQMIKRSPEEWCTWQVVQDGISLRQISSSEFQAAACSAMRLKHYKSHTTVAKVVMEYIEGMKEKTRKEIVNKMEAGERFSAIADEWTSIRNRRFKNVCIKTSNYTANLGLIRCKGSVTSEVVCDMVKVGRAEYKCFLC
jgi:hypothetical protein